MRIEVTADGYYEADTIEKHWYVFRGLDKESRPVIVETPHETMMFLVAHSGKCNEVLYHSRVCLYENHGADWADIRYCRSVQDA